MASQTNDTQEQIHDKSVELSKKSNGIIPFMEDEVQRFEGESYKYFTPSKALYLNYLISLVANRDVNQPNDLYSNISLNNLHDIFSNEEINEIPIKAKEAINRIKWWQSQEESMTNVV